MESGYGGLCCPAVFPTGEASNYAGFQLAEIGRKRSRMGGDCLCYIWPMPQLYTSDQRLTS
jgi:hypothetical protein